MNYKGMVFICDNMAGFLIKQGRIQRVLVETYSIAVLAQHHGVPFHPVAPLSTVDFNCPSGDYIPIEELSLGVVAPKMAQVYNPAFDVTPVEYIHSLILDCGSYSKLDLQAGILTTLKNHNITR